MTDGRYGVQFLAVSKASLVWFVVTLLVLGLLVVYSPLERTLGVNVRVVYLHGAWVWTALALFLAAGLVGLVGLIQRRWALHHWSRALGRTGLLFWLTYLPISMWAMQTSWNGLYLSEPRWRMAIIFAIGGILLQLGVTLVEDPGWASGANLLYFTMLLLALVNTESVMHPPSPILNSNSQRIQLYFGLLVALTLLAAWQVARWWSISDPEPAESKSR